MLLRSRQAPNQGRISVGRFLANPADTPQEWGLELPSSDFCFPWSRHTSMPHCDP